ncbi:MAG: DinB family protein [Ignavibacteriae bacterium]|nr:DinB family protein [Ignavibacteriota bacterium]
MKKTEQLAYRFREIILNGIWIANTNYKDQLEKLDWEIATSKFETLNTIAILAQHVHYYINGIKNVFKGGNLEIKDKYSFDFSEIKSQDEWEGFLTKFWKDAENLAELIAQLPDEKLNQSFVDEKYGSYQRNIDGLIEHSYYHLGQIVLIKKIILTTK